MQIYLLDLSPSPILFHKYISFLSKLILIYERDSTKYNNNAETNFPDCLIVILVLGFFWFAAEKYIYLKGGDGLYVGGTYFRVQETPHSIILRDDKLRT